MIHELFESFCKLLLYIFHLSLVLKMKFFLFQIELISPYDKLLQSIEHILLYEPEIIIEFLPMNVVLDLIVKTNSLQSYKQYKIFIAPHLLRKLQTESLLLQIVPHTFAFV